MQTVRMAGLVISSAASKKETVVLLRWVLIIAFSYLLVLDRWSGSGQAPVVLLISVALASNLIIGRLPEAWMDKPVFDFAIVLFDAAWVTLGLTWAPNVSGDLFLLYFLVIFVAAVGESLPMIVGSAVVVSAVYGTAMSVHGGGDFRLATTELLRVPFLFVVALFYGYFVTEIRGRRSETAEARLREQAKSELLAAVSHDLRGPLGNAENLLALALDGSRPDVPANRMLLVRAHVNVRRVSALVNNLLQTACIEAGQMRLQLAAVEVNDVIDEVFDLEAGAALLREVALSREPSPEGPLIMADFMQIERIVTNLVNNAIKYTEPGARVVIRTSCDPDSVRISVEDTGPGMSAEQCDALFAPYRRVHLGGYTPGTGLGLFISKKLTEAQGGAISVNSIVGVGSSFVVTFPRIRQAEDGPTLVPMQQDTPAAAPHRAEAQAA